MISIPSKAITFRFFGELFLAAFTFILALGCASAATTDGNLRMEVTTAYNFIVDSNVTSPSTNAPRSAYISARIWNDGSVPITNVRAYIGNKVANTPGVYPSRVHTENPGIVGPLAGGAFAITHEGGSLGVLDASRQFPSIPAGGYIPVYWLVSYPNLDINGNSVTGGSKPSDDLYLNYDIWATGDEGVTPRAVDVRRRATMRNCISAMANKIFPNGANKVPQEYLDLLAKYAPEWNSLAADGSPGTTITTEGIWYDLGNVGQGFDNDGNLVPDQNAWLQPVGNPRLFDSSAFRLQRTFALIVVKLKDGGEQVYDVNDQLYFTNLPDNNGVVGLVRYDYLSMKPGATSTTSPYQMAASGFENEKFNGDYGTSFGMPTQTTALTLTKNVNLATANPGDQLNYTINFTNPGSQTVGNPDLGLPIVVKESIPPGTKFVVGTAAATPPGGTSFEIRYSSDNGVTWTTTAPATQGAADAVTHIQWWLSAKLVPAAAGTVTFSVKINNPYLLGGSPSGSPVVNVAGLAFGDADPFLTANASTGLIGARIISGTVYQDTGVGTGGIFGDAIKNGTEPAIANVTTKLYYDTNNNNVVDSGDILLSSAITNGSGNYSFTGLPNGEYVVQVDRQDTDIPTGNTPTSPVEIAVTLSGSDSTGNNFGFAPTLVVTKTGTTTAYTGGAVSYTIGVENKYTATRQDIYTQYATAMTNGSNQKAWTNPTNAQGAPDSVYAVSPFSNASEELTMQTYTAPPAGSLITKVELLITGKGSNIGSAGTNGKLVPSFTGVTLNTAATADITDTGFNTGAGPDYTFVRELTKNPVAAWTLAEVTAFAVKITTNKGSAASTFSMDSVGLRITVTPSNTLTTVPLSDTYNANELQFVSATPAQTSNTVVGSVGTLTWSNIGPIASAATANVTVNFTAKSLSGANSITTTDTARVTGAQFAGNMPANDGQASAQTVILPTSSIGDTIYKDSNRSGSQDLSEPGISGVTVQLYQSNVLVTSQVTNASGNYLFTNLTPGTYEVRVVTASGPLTAGGAWALSSDPDLDGVPYDPLNPNPLGDSRTTSILSAGEFNAGADFGYYPPGYELSGTAWIDFDNDGIVDASEIGIQYATVNLYIGSNPIPVTTTTDAEGAYTFVGLSNGSHRVEVITTPTPTAFPPNLTQTYDPDVTLNNQTTVTIAGADIEDVNFGYRYPGTNTLSGTIGMDVATFDGLLNGTNPSGVAAGEMPFSDVTVYLYAWNDPDNDLVIDSGEAVLLGSTTTGVNGDYSFSGLPASEFYLVSMTAPYNNLLITTTSTTPNHPADTVVVSSNSQGHTTGAYAVVPAATATTNVDFAFEFAVDYDFGDLPASYSTLLSDNGARHIRPVSPNLYLGASVSIDVDGQPSTAANLDTLDNGVTVAGIHWQNETNGGTATVTVEGSGWLVGYIDFNNNGNFTDNGEMVVSKAVTTGTQNHTFNIPAGALDEEGSTGLYARFRLLPSQPMFPQFSYTGEAANGEVEDYLWNFHSITGKVFEDDTTAGFNLGDIFANGVLVELWQGSTRVDSQLTGLDGSYSFYGLTSGNYEVRMTPPAGSTAILDVDGNINTYEKIDVTVTNATVTGRDFLLDTVGLSYASLSGSAFIDTVNDNDFTVGDTKFAGVSISLYRDLNTDGIADPGEFVGSVITNSTGDYSFPNLANANYLVKVTQPSVATPIKDIDGGSNDQIAVTMAGTNIINQNFLFDLNASISGTIRIDTSGDTTGESPHAGVVVQLLSSTNTVLFTTTTDASGYYNFPIGTAGNYRVRQIVPTNYYAVDDVDGGGLEVIGDITLISVVNGANVINQDFVNRELCSVGDFVWYDADEDGIKDAIEIGVNGVTVRLLDSTNAVLATTTTANNGSSQPGYYSFANLETGGYKVEFVLPDAGYQFSPQNADSNGLLAGAANSDAIINSGRTAVFMLTPGLDTLNVDAGIYQTTPCPDTWTEWKQIHPGETATGNPDADSYVNFTEFAFAMPYDNGIGSNWLKHTAWIVRESTVASDTLEGVFIRPKGAYLNVVYSIQYAASTGNPTVWTTLELTQAMINSGVIDIVDNGDCTETVIIRDLETRTGLAGGTGVVRIKADLDDDGLSNGGPLTLTKYVESEGWTRTPLAGTCQTYNIPYVRESVFTGTVSSVSGQNLIFNGQDLTSLLVSGSYYLEVTTGDHEGQRYDVSATSGTAATLVNDNDIYSGVPYNNTAGAPPSTATFAEDTVAIRRHWTLGEALPVTDFTASNVPTTADQVQIFVNGALQTYWVNDLGDGNPLTARWVLTGDGTLADQAGVVIPPGYGMFFTRRGAATSNLSYGEIRTNKFIWPLKQGSNLVGGGYPVNQSPAGTGGRAMARGNSGVGFFGSGDFKYADSIFVWKRDADPLATGVYETYFLLYAASYDQWVRQGDIGLASRGAETLMLYDRAVFIRSKEYLPTYTIPSPWTP